MANKTLSFRSHILFYFLNSCHTDVNECSSADLNNCDQLCTNEPGSFSCSCNDGYLLAEDLHTCHGT